MLSIQTSECKDTPESRAPILHQISLTNVKVGSHAKEKHKGQEHIFWITYLVCDEMTSLRHKTSMNAFLLLLFGFVLLIKKNQLKDNCFIMWYWFLMYSSMRCNYTCVPSLLNFSHNPYPIPLLQVVVEYQIEIPVINGSFPLAVCFTYGTTCVSMLLSQFASTSPSPTMSISLFSMSVSLFLPCKQVYQYRFS